MIDTSHYKKASFSVEPYVICALFPFTFGNVLKYILRADYKGDPIGDLNKAIDYLRKLCDRRGEVSHVVNLLKTDHVRTLLLCCDNIYIKELLEFRGERLERHLISVVESDIRHRRLKEYNDSKNAVKVTNNE